MKPSSSNRVDAGKARRNIPHDSSLPEKVQELLKILSYENSRGWRDNSVFGGLSKYLARWEKDFEGSADILPSFQSALRIVSSLVGYSSLSSPERAPLLSRAITELAGLTKTGDTNSNTAEEAGPGHSLPTTTVPAATVAGREKVAHVSPTAQKSSTSRQAIQLRESVPPHITPSTSILDSPVTTIKGVNTATALRLRKLGVQSVKDLLYLFPRRHNDFSTMKRIADLAPGAEETVVATVWEVSTRRLGKSGRVAVELVLGDETGNMRAVFFNQPHMAKAIRASTQVVLSGRVDLFRGQKVFESPQYENLESDDFVHTGRIVPVYPLTEGLYQRSVRRIIKSAVDRWSPAILDHLPETIRRRANLLELSYAISQIHYPDSHKMLDKAKERLAFDELFAIQLGALRLRREWRESQPGNAMVVDQKLVDQFLGSLPFQMTNAQRRALVDILADQSKPEPMTRLLQGEVGSGKTVVAAAALLVAVANGYQGVLMAPTEILAEQHFRTLTRLYGDFAASSQSPPPTQGLPVPNVLLLTGSLKRGEKDGVHKSIRSGDVDIVVGTQAIIQEGVEFKRLGLSIVDEQHRFGVLQRSALRQMGYNPDVLVMTATPIPRTLALTLYGDLDLAVIDELPPGRMEIKTKWLKPDERYRAYNFIRRQVTEGRQAFIICPLVEESDKIEAKAATAEYERLSTEVFSDLRLGLLHGRMRPAEKDRVMQQFGAGELDILVCTTVVEVGIDVPNATVMLVEGADRFGLSQLHQLRGRVGRGRQQSYCILLADSPSSQGQERLSIIEKTQDGFVLAEEDLRLRGPGEFLGTRQSGLPDLKVAKISDVRLIELARREALALFNVDPDLAMPENRMLAQHIATIWQRQSELS